MELQGAYQAIRGEGAELLAISTDDIQGAGNMAQYVGAQYPVLADADSAVTRRYGVYNLLGDRVAAPAVFIVDGSGAIAWRYVGKHIADRPHAGEVLQQLKKVRGAQG